MRQLKILIHIQKSFLLFLFSSSFPNLLLFLFKTPLQRSFVFFVQPGFLLFIERATKRTMSASGSANATNESDAATNEQSLAEKRALCTENCNMILMYCCACAKNRALQREARFEVPTDVGSFLALCLVVASAAAASPVIMQSKMPRSTQTDIHVWTASLRARAQTHTARALAV